MPFERRGANDLFRYEKACKFIGSVALSMHRREDTPAFVNEKLLEMKDVGISSSPVVISVTGEGIKILNEDRTAVKMAHGITRVLFFTCHPDRKLFAYVSKASGGANGSVVAQAHMFKTAKVEHIKKLNSSVSRAIKIGFSRNTAKRVRREELFEKEAEKEKEVRNVLKKNWAKIDVAFGHENSPYVIMKAKSEGSIPEAVSDNFQNAAQKIDREALISGKIEAEYKDGNNNLMKTNPENKTLAKQGFVGAIVEHTVNVIAYPFLPRKQNSDDTITELVDVVLDFDKNLNVTIT